jgi:CBS domain-containing protein
MSYFVKDYMRKDIVALDEAVSVLEASRTMLAKSIDYVIVLSKGQPIGILTSHDIVMEAVAKEKIPAKVKVSEIMSSPLVGVDPDADVQDAVKTMVEHSVRTLGVVRDNILYGTLGARDLARHFNEYSERVTTDIVRAMSHVSIPF